jgi:hypothetical protein
MRELIACDRRENQRAAFVPSGFGAGLAMCRCERKKLEPPNRSFKICSIPGISYEEYHP